MKNSIIILTIVICVFGISTVWAVEIENDDGVRIFRTSSTPNVIMADYDSTGGGSAIYGYTTASTGLYTRGVTGNSASTSGRGVYGIASAMYGVTYGVYGLCHSEDGSAIYGANSDPDGHAGYFNGKVSVFGDLYVKGDITQQNLALSATATAKSIYSGGYPATNVIDGIKGQWDNGEWASNGEHDDTWVKLSWITPQTISKCVFYDRSNKYDNITDAWLYIDQTGDGIAEYEIHLGAFPIGGAEKIVNLTTAQGTNVRSMKLYITESLPSSLNVGLSEWECY